MSSLIPYSDFNISYRYLLENMHFYAKFYIYVKLIKLLQYK